MSPGHIGYIPSQKQRRNRETCAYYSTELKNIRTGRMEFRLKLGVYPPKLSIRSERRDPAASLWADPRDAWICSYPKSGNTWMRFCLANLLRPSADIDFSSVAEIVPDIYHLNREKISSIKPRRFLKSHEAFRPDYRRVLYLCRDPRDVLVSYFHYCRKQSEIPDETSLEDFAERFLEGDLPTKAVGSWAENVGSWLGARHASRNFLLIRYEDLTENPHTELARAAKFLGIPHGDADIANAIEASSAKKMRSLEGRRKTPRPDMPFVRKARAGGWRTELPAPLASEVEQRWAPLMRELGYLN